MKCSPFSATWERTNHLADKNSPEQKIRSDTEHFSCNSAVVFALINIRSKNRCING